MTWKEIITLASEAEIKAEDLWRMSWGEVEAAIEGYLYRLAKQVVMSRELLAATININRKEGSMPVRGSDLMPLVIDRNYEEKERITKEEWEEVNNLLNNIKWQRSIS